MKKQEKIHNTKLNKENRVMYLDVLNILACICVVLLHCNGIVHTYSKITAWKTSLIVEVVCYWAVPIFLMCSGATLMKYRERYDTKTFFKKRFIKVGIPFIFWTIFMIVWKYAIGSLTITSWSIKEILNIIFNNKEESTYYFMFIILGVYLTMPILSLLAKEEYRKVLWYAVGMMFLTISTLPVVLKLMGITYNNYLSVLFNGYLIFILLGYLLSTTELNKKQRCILYVLAILGCIFRYTGIYILSTRDNAVNRTLFDYNQFHSVLLAAAVFVFIKNIKWNEIIKKEKIQNILIKISSCSFGIFLINKIIIYYEVKLLNINQNSIHYRTWGAIITYLICLGIIYLLKKIPIVKKIVP